jgi:uncharacterized membrane protein YhiD involved in acid resistance
VAFANDSTARLAVDPTRVAAQVVTGIGFLGAGAIIRRGVNVRGLTTAASLWVTAAIGTAVGLDYVEGAIVVTVAALISLYGLKAVERYALSRLRRGRIRFLIEARTSCASGNWRKSSKVWALVWNHSRFRTILRRAPSSFWWQGCRRVSGPNYSPTGLARFPVSER